MKIITLNNFNLNQIAESGQCFRFKRTDDNKYSVVAFNKYLEAEDLGDDRFSFSCDEKEWEDTWAHYFDVETDYAEIGRIIMASDDAHLKEAFLEGSGIRILNQDLFEIIVSFLISQNNNIKRIKKSIELISQKAGVKVPGHENEYAFPGPGQVPGDFFDDVSLGLGYRNVYLKEFYEFIGNNPDWLCKLKVLSYEEARKELLRLKGIGPKVADCVCLFGLHHIDAFPVDTHVKQLLDKYYKNGFNDANFTGFRGILQQYLFFYELNHSK